MAAVEAAKDPVGGTPHADPAVEQLRRGLRQQEHKYSVALKQIGSLQAELKRLHERARIEVEFGGKSEQDLKEEIGSLRRQVEERGEAYR